MELLFLTLLIIIMAVALGSGYPVAFALPGSAVLAIAIAALSGYLYAGSIDFFFVNGGPTAWLSTGVTNARGLYWVIERDTLIAIPLFIFMGLMLQRSKVAEDLLLAMAQLFGPVRGGLGISVVFVGALLAATTGIVGATVIAMGMISLPAMLRNSYDKSLATGTIAASGTLGQIIPPSIVLLILVDQLTAAVDQASATRRALYKESTGNLLMPSEFDVFSVSAGEMFMGAFIPGLVLVAFYMSYVLAVGFFKPASAPAVPYEGRYDLTFALRIVLALVPPLALIFAVLGSIIAGVATVNQAGAIGAAGALLMASYRLFHGKRWAYAPAILAVASMVAIGVIVAVYDVNLRKIISPRDIEGAVLAAVASTALVFALGWSGWRIFKIDRTMKTVVEETAKTTSLVFIILLGATMLTAAFRGFGGEELVREYLQNLPGGFWAQFALVMAVIFVLGFFLDFIEITVVVVPIIAPILLADPSANIAAVWLGVMIGLNIQTSFLTPPFGFALFYLRGVAASVVRTMDIYKGVIPFIIIQLLALVAVAVYPTLVSYLPTRVSLGVESSPPPTNPRLQYCIEEFVDAEFRMNGAAIRQAVAEVRSVDYSVLPQSLRARLTGAFDQAENAFEAMARIKQTAADVRAASPTYRPVHDKVRRIEGTIRRIDKEIEKNRTIVSWAGGSRSLEEGRNAEARIKVLADERSDLAAQIPTDWKDLRVKMAAKLKAHRDARLHYRRTVDAAYDPVMEVIRTIKGGEQLQALETKLILLIAEVDEVSADDLDKQLKELYGQAGRMRGADKIEDALTHARRKLHAQPAARVSVARKLQDAIAVIGTERSWRNRAANTDLAELVAYEAAIAETIGIRSRPRLSDRVAAEISPCVATPRDIYLNF